MKEAGSLRRAVPFVLMLVVGAWLWTVADGFAIATRLGRAGPDLWPKIVLSLLLAAAVLGIIEAMTRSSVSSVADVIVARSSSGPGGNPDDALDEAAGATVEPSVWPAVGGIAVMLGFVAAIPYVGYTVATFALLLSIMLLAGYRNRLRALLIAGLGTLAFFFVFQRIAYVALPLGVGPFKTLSTSLMTLMGVR